MFLPMNVTRMLGEGVKRIIPSAVISEPNASALAFFRTMLPGFPEKSAFMLLTVRLPALRVGMLAASMISGLSLEPEILRVPESLPLTSGPYESANDSRGMSVNMKLKSAASFPDTDAVPAPVIIPSPLRAVSPPSIILSPCLCIVAFAPVKVVPPAVTESAATFTLISIIFTKSTLKAVVSSAFLAVTKSISQTSGAVARRFTERLSNSPAIFKPAFTVPLSPNASTPGA